MDTKRNSNVEVESGSPALTRVERRRWQTPALELGHAWEAETNISFGPEPIILVS